MKSESLEGRRWIGRVLRDRWRIDARISRGGVGTVYAATHKNNGSRAAIKVLHPEFARDADTRSRFLQEGYAANQVNHPGVVRILDDDTSEDGHAYLVMELLEGELLETRRVRKGGKLAMTDVYEVGEQLLDVLAAAHEKGIVHRDIKPDNLFITQEGRLKVLDFGFAQMRSQFRPDVTATGFLLGTPGFMSPEQAVGNRAEVDAQTDIWAVGATLFTLISGEPVHAGQSAAEMLVAAANFQPRSLAAVARGTPMRLVEVVDRAVAFDKADRWPNARSMQFALRSVSGKQQAGAVSRRSIPDIEPVSDGPTLYEDPMFIEELDANDLVDSQSGGWPNESKTAPSAGQPDSEGATMVALAPSPVTDRPEPMPQTMPPATPHMLAPQTKPPTTSQMAPHPGQTRHTPASLTDPSLDGGTLIMESPPRDDRAGGSGAYLAADGSGAYLAADGSGAYLAADGSGAYPALGGHASPAPFRPLKGPSAAASPQPSLVPTTQSRPQPRTTPPAETGGTSGVLVFAGVAVVTMVIVIVAGLLILTFSD